MVERQRLTASEVGGELASRELSESERRRRGLLLPELRLRTDTPTIEVDETTPVIQALARLGEEETGAVAIRERNGEPQAVVLSVERYLQLAGKEINSAAKVGTLEGSLVPTATAFERAHVEQVDPNASWGHQAPKATT